jgi:predicted MFS family arabinose efflux permease
MAHLAPSSVPVALSLDLTAFNIGIATAALAGGAVVDHWSATILPVLALPVVVLALAIWLVTTRPAPMAPAGAPAVAPAGAEQG